MDDHCSGGIGQVRHVLLTQFLSPIRRIQYKMKLNLYLAYPPPFSHVTFCLAISRFVTFFLGLPRLARERILLMFVNSDQEATITLVESVLFETFHF